MTIIIRRPWGSQPQNIVGINPSSSFSRGLSGLWLPTPLGMMDLTQYRNHGTARTGAPSIVPSARRGLAYQYTSGAYFTAGSTTPAATGTNYTFAVWVKFATSPVPYGMVITRQAGSGNGWEISTDGSGGSARKLYFYNANVRASTDAVGAGEWHLWMFSNNGDALNGSWYTDGSLNGSNANTTAASGTGDIRFNRRSDGYESNHAIGPCYFWNNRAFSAAEARAFFYQELDLYQYRRCVLPINVPSAATAPTLSALSAINVTTTSAQPRITYTF